MMVKYRELLYIYIFIFFQFFIYLCNYFVKKLKVFHNFILIRRLQHAMQDNYLIY